MDEHPRSDTDLETLSEITLAFRDEGEGFHHAGNSSGIVDGSSAVLVTSEEAAKEHGWEPIACIVEMEVAGVDPLTVLKGPMPATERVLEKANMDIDDIDLFEVNEAFAAVVAARLEETGASWEDTNVNGSALAVECDVTDRKAVENLVDEILSTFGGIDVLVNSAGASFMADFDDLSANDWKKIVDINLHGTYHCSQAAGPALKDGDGAVINISSTCGIYGSLQMSHYGAAKAGIQNFTRSLSANWASDNVRVNCIASGIIATEGIKSQMGIEEDKEINRSEVDRDIGERVEIADVAQFLASSAASYVTGQALPICGVPRVTD